LHYVSTARNGEEPAITPGTSNVVGVDGDPLQDVGKAFRDIRWVMKGGKVVVDRTSVANLFYRLIKHGQQYVIR
jgi:hypothetical protein